VQNLVKYVIYSVSIYLAAYLHLFVIVVKTLIVIVIFVHFPSPT